MKPQKSMIIFAQPPYAIFVRACLEGKNKKNSIEYLPCPCTREGGERGEEKDNTSREIKTTPCKETPSETRLCSCPCIVFVINIVTTFCLIFVVTSMSIIAYEKT